MGKWKVSRWVVLKALEMVESMDMMMETRKVMRPDLRMIPLKGMPTVQRMEPHLEFHLERNLAMLTGVQWEQW